MGSQPAPRRSESVSLDWRTPLSSEKNLSYGCILHRVHICYGMLSVNLNEALGVRRIGRHDIACQVLTLAPALCDKLTASLRSLIRAMFLHARHFGTAPNIAALDPENFQNSRSQKVARFNGILSRVILTRRSQFLQKLSALVELVEDLGRNYDQSAEELAEGLSLDEDRCWTILDTSHHDLNTCLRETDVLLKSFLLALPEKQLAEFQAAVRDQDRTAKVGVPFLTRNLAHRRLTSIKGQ